MAWAQLKSPVAASARPGPGYQNTTLNFVVIRSLLILLPSRHRPPAVSSTQQPASPAAQVFIPSHHSLSRTQNPTAPTLPNIPPFQLRAFEHFLPQPRAPPMPSRRPPANQLHPAARRAAAALVSGSSRRPARPEATCRIGHGQRTREPRTASPANTTRHRLIPAPTPPPPSQPRPTPPRPPQPGTIRPPPPAAAPCARMPASPRPTPAPRTEVHCIQQTR